MIILLIPLAILLTILLAAVAYKFVKYALPFMVTLTVFRFLTWTGAGSIIALIFGLIAGALALGIALSLAGSAKSGIMRGLGYAAILLPSMIGGYALVHGITKNAFESAISLHLFCLVAGTTIAFSSLSSLVRSEK